MAGGEVGASGSVGGLDPTRLFGGLRDLTDPGRLAGETARLLLDLADIAAGTSEVAIPERDKRFADVTWTENPFYRRLAQTYLAWSASVDRLANARELRSDWRRHAQARYTGGLLTAMLAPTNFFWGNPTAVKRAFDTGG
ncbi:MAG: poly-beta-hydroxybutyrate polymerase, partial [Gaiellaceae bacterium]